MRGGDGDPDALVRPVPDADHDHRRQAHGAGDAEVDPPGHDHQHLAEGGDPQHRPVGSDGAQGDAAQGRRSPDRRHDDQEEQRDVHRQVPGRHDERGERRRRGPRARSCRHLPSTAPTSETGGGGHPLLGRRSPGRGRVARPPRGPRRASATRPPTNTQSTFDVSMPHTTAPIGSLIGKMLGRSVRSTTTSACMPGSRDPVTATEPRHPGAVDGGVADHVARAHQVREHRAFPASLRSKTVACCMRDRRPHLGEHVARGDPLVVDPQARPDVAVDQLLDRRRPETRSPSRSTGASDTEAPDDAMASRSASSSPERWTSVTSSPRSPRAAASEITPCPELSDPAWAWMRRPSSPGRSPIAPATALEIRRTRAATVPNATLVERSARRR